MTWDSEAEMLEPECSTGRGLKDLAAGCSGDGMGDPSTCQVHMAPWAKNKVACDGATAEPREVHDRELDMWRERSDLSGYNRRYDVFVAFNTERQRQIAKWGPDQSHPDGTGGRGSQEREQTYKALCEARMANGTVSWMDILLEEVMESGAEGDERALEVELVQVGAVVTAWIEDLRARRARA